MLSLRKKFECKIKKMANTKFYATKFYATMAIIVFSLTIVFSSCGDNPSVRVLLVTGGHDFDKEPFYELMHSLEGVSFSEVMHPNALQMFRPENRDLFDVILFYDMPGVISEQEKQDFIDCLRAGKGVVVLHHAYCSYQNWDEYQNIVGGRYHEKSWIDDQGYAQPASSYKYDVLMRAKVADKSHPVTSGIEDFDIIDETYANGVVNPGVHLLLTTDEPSSTPAIAWTNRYGNSDVVTIPQGQITKKPHADKIGQQVVKTLTNNTINDFSLHFRNGK